VTAKLTKSLSRIGLQQQNLPNPEVIHGCGNKTYQILEEIRIAVMNIKL